MKKAKLFELKDKLKDVQHYNQSTTPEKMLEFVSLNLEKEIMASHGHRYLNFRFCSAKD